MLIIESEKALIIVVDLSCCSVLPILLLINQVLVFEMISKIKAYKKQVRDLLWVLHRFFICSNIVLIIL